MEFNVNPDELEEFSPERLAHTIFSTDPKPACSNQIIALQEGADLTYIFQILVTVFMEGFEMFTDGFENMDLSNFTTDHISSFDPWFRSLGFKIQTETVEMANKESYEDYYCKIVIKTPLYETLFIMKGIEDKKYHFLLNGKYMEQNKKKDKIKDLRAVFINDANDTVYIISFDTCME